MQPTFEETTQHMKIDCPVVRAFVFNGPSGSLHIMYIFMIQKIICIHITDCQKDFSFKLIFNTEHLIDYLQN